MHGNLSLYPVTFLSTIFLHRFRVTIFFISVLGLACIQMVNLDSVYSTILWLPKLPPPTFEAPVMARCSRRSTRWDLQYSHVKVDKWWLQIDILCHDRLLSFVRIIGTQREVLRTKEVLRRPFGSEVASTYCPTLESHITAACGQQLLRKALLNFTRHTWHIILSPLSSSPKLQYKIWRCLCSAFRPQEAWVKEKEDPHHLLSKTSKHFICSLSWPLKTLPLP